MFSEKNPGFMCKQMLDEFQVCWDVYCGKEKVF